MLTEYNISDLPSLKNYKQHGSRNLRKSLKRDYWMDEAGTDQLNSLIAK
jgi:hypothetical protein